MSMIRRFVNIAAENYNSGVCTVRRLDVSKHLFYPSTSHAQEANTTGGIIERLQELPAPCLSIPPAPTAVVDDFKRAIFGLVSPSSSEGRILHVNKTGHSLLYDADSQHSSCMPSLNRDKGRMPILVSVAPPDSQDHSEEDIYVMARNARLDVLRLSGTRPEWQVLPPPPFVGSLGYDQDGPETICSHTVVDGGRSICVSFSDGFGTYCFDTVEGAWRRLGDWVLPFDDGAEYASDLNLWLGFSPESPHYLCWTSELSAMVIDQPPELQGTWEDLCVPENWLPTTLTLVNLGAGRFCIAKIFLVKRERDTWDSDGNYDHLDIECEIAVFTGVEIGRGAQGLMVLKHKSILYQFQDDVIQWVL